MEFKDHLNVLRMCGVYNITKGVLIRQIYDLIKDHEGKDFKDIDDLFTKLYPKTVVKRVAGGVHVRRRRRPRRENPFYNTPIQDLEEEAQE